MKKQTILLLAGGMLALASCGGGNPPQDNAQAKVDSMQKAMEMQQREQAVKDSMNTVMAAEKAKADSLAGAMKAAEAHPKGPAHKGHETARTTPPPAPVAVPTSPAPSPVNNRPGANGPKSVNDRPGAH